MIGKEVVEESPVTLAKVLEILRKRKKKGELGFGQRMAYDYAQKFASLSVKKAEKLVDDLIDTEKVMEHQAAVLANLMPETRSDVRLIFAKERTSLTDEDIDEILEIIDGYRE